MKKQDIFNEAILLNSNFSYKVEDGQMFNYGHEVDYDSFLVVEEGELQSDTVYYFNGQDLVCVDLDDCTYFKEQFFYIF